MRFAVLVAAVAGLTGSVCAEDQQGSFETGASADLKALQSSREQTNAKEDEIDLTSAPNLKITAQRAAEKDSSEGKDWVAESLAVMEGELDFDESNLPRNAVILREYLAMQAEVRALKNLESEKQRAPKTEAGVTGQASTAADLQKALFNRWLETRRDPDNEQNPYQELPSGQNPDVSRNPFLASASAYESRLVMEEDAAASEAAERENAILESVKQPQGEHRTENNADEADTIEVETERGPYRPEEDIRKKRLPQLERF